MTRPVVDAIADKRDDLRDCLAMVLSVRRGSEVIWADDRAAADALMPVLADIAAEHRVWAALFRHRAATLDPPPGTGDTP